MLKSSPPSFILASASPRRVALLSQIGIAPKEVVASHIDESVQKGELPKNHAIRMAQAKAEKIWQDKKPTPVLSADTVVAMGRRILAKPDTIEEARDYLQKLQGRRFRIITAMVLITERMTAVRQVTSILKMKPLNQDEITHYLKSQEWQGRAGGVALDGRAGAFVAWLNGSYSACLGLDLKTTYQLLKGIGYNHP